MEQFTITSQRCGLIVQSLTAVTEDTSVCIAAPQRSVNCELLQLRRIQIILLTYLLIYPGPLDQQCYH